MLLATLVSNKKKTPKCHCSLADFRLISTSHTMSHNDSWLLGPSLIDNSSYSTFIFATIFVLSFILGICANLLVIYAFLTKKQLRSHTNIFFINLSISDILVILVCCPVALSDLFLPENWYYGYIYCKLPPTFLFIRLDLTRMVVVFFFLIMKRQALLFHRILRNFSVFAHYNHH